MDHLGDLGHLVKNSLQILDRKNTVLLRNSPEIKKFHHICPEIVDGIPYSDRAALVSGISDERPMR